MIDVVGLIGLFGAAFLAATLFPAQSEVILAAMVLGGSHSLIALLIVASVGNVLGSCVNWWLGLQINRFRGRRWFPVSEKALEKGRVTFARWGWPSLLLSWAPIIGDPLTLVAGLMKEPLWRFLLVVAVAKTARYAMVIGLAERFSG